jgi:microcystin-dependent protein
MQPGQGPGLSERSLGEQGGVENVTLLTTEMPAHSHTLRGSLEDDDSTLPGGNYFGQLSTVYAEAQGLTAMASGSILPSGSGFPHNNMMPYLTLNFCIALQGIFPSHG